MRSELQKQMILVVDDDVTNLRVISEYLEGYGFEILVARHGEDGIKKARLVQPDLILLDIMMPGIDGFETCRRLKSDDSTQHIPIIFLTALDNVENKVKGFAVGGVDYVTKPLQEDEVLARVRTHLQLQAQKRQLQQQAIELKYAKEEAEAAQRTAEKANQSKSLFLANMSHELRTPLNTILGFSQIMVHDSHTFEEQEYLTIIQRSGEHLLTLVNQILDLSKIEAGHITLDERDFDLDALLNNMEYMFRLRSEQKGLQLILERDPNIPRYVRTDEVKLRQVLINLLNNAIKFTTDGSVTLGLVDRGSRNTQPEFRILEFVIKDTGPGIAAEEMDKLFEAFEQTATGRRIQEGTGLGLPISRKFIQLMGGKISVTSEVGVGSIFTFEIKVKLIEALKPDTQRRKTPQRVIALAPDQPPYRILIVDDNADNRLLLIKLLSSLGVECREATNGQEAFELWKQWEPHLIWTDLHMPVMDGFEATKIIREHETQNAKHKTRTVIIAVTASAYEEERGEALAMGCDDFIRKPFREHEIFDLLQKQLGIRFIYEVKEGDDDSKQKPVSEDVLIPAALVKLPQDLITELKQATTISDITRLETIIRDIRSHNVLLAEALTYLVKDFDYTRILALIRQTKQDTSDPSP